MGMTIELIDKQELLDWIQNCWDWATVDGITSTTVLKQTMTDISQLPTVEAIPKADYENRLKADMVAILVELQIQFEEKGCENMRDCWWLLEEKIDKLKENTDGNK